MTEESKQTMLKVLSEEQDSTILSTYLILAENAILRHLYPFGRGDEVLPEEYETLQVEIAAYFINKQGAMGESRHSENGIDRTYEDADIPPTMLRRIIPKASVV